MEEHVLVREKNECLDVLKFLNDNMNRYPELSFMARDVLSIPISTVTPESTFSIGGWVIGEFQSSILPENAEAQLCTQDWIYGHGGKKQLCMYYVFFFLFSFYSLTILFFFCLLLLMIPTKMLL